MEQVPIETIKEDDMILCFKDGLQQFMPAFVVDRHDDFTSDLIEVEYGCGKKILVTYDHAMLIGE